jgi:hypothetical protein
MALPSKVDGFDAQQGNEKSGKKTESGSMPSEVGTQRLLQ